MIVGCTCDPPPRRTGEQPHAALLMGPARIRSRRAQLLHSAASCDAWRLTSPFRTSPRCSRRRCPRAPSSWLASADSPCRPCRKGSVEPPSRSFFETSPISATRSPRERLDHGLAQDAPTRVRLGKERRLRMGLREALRQVSLIVSAKGRAEIPDGPKCLRCGHEPCPSCSDEARGRCDHCIDAEQSPDHNATCEEGACVYDPASYAAWWTTVASQLEAIFGD